MFPLVFLLKFVKIGQVLQDLITNNMLQSWADLFVKRRNRIKSKYVLDTNVAHRIESPVVSASH